MHVARVEDTIVALSSGRGRAAIAVVRMSGSRVRFVIETVLRTQLVPRTAKVVTVFAADSISVLDRCVALFFDGPRSSTGEDCLELQVHGSVGIVRGVLGLLCAVPGVRLAEPGEFSRRSLENGKLDLLQVEALGDLLEAETSEQVRQAQWQLGGDLGRMARDWVDRLTRLRAQVEARLDFSDEGDVDGDLGAEFHTSIELLVSEFRGVLGQAERARRIRDGASVVLLGGPNSGKSTLINALAGRDVAIVSDIAGTTRDTIEAYVDLQGWPVVFVDTAGIRETGNVIETEGVRRAIARAEDADILVLVSSPDVPEVLIPQVPDGAAIIKVGTKSDIRSMTRVDVNVSARTGDGLDHLRRLIGAALERQLAGEPALVARERQRSVLAKAEEALARALVSQIEELIAEELREAAFQLGVLVGHTDLDTVLDRLFEGFCIGK